MVQKNVYPRTVVHRAYLSQNSGLNSRPVPEQWSTEQYSTVRVLYSTRALTQYCTLLYRSQSSRRLSSPHAKHCLPPLRRLPEAVADIFSGRHGLPWSQAAVVTGCVTGCRNTAGRHHLRHHLLQSPKYTKDTVRATGYDTVMYSTREFPTVPVFREKFLGWSRFLHAAQNAQA